MPAIARDRKIELRGEDGTSAIVNPEGAFVESLQAPGGSDLLFPRQSVNGKDRGGIPVCAPVFGPGSRVGLAQHGFARNLTWETLEQGPNGITLTLVNPHLQDPTLEAYADSEMQLDLVVGPNELTMNLSIVNNGDEPFVASPGFHPYFPVEHDYRAEEVKVNGVSYSTQALLETRTLNPSPNNETEVKLPEGKVTLSSDSLEVPVVWSANPDQYICVEPTTAGAVTSEGSQADLNDYMCNPGEEKRYSMTIKWGK